MASLFNTKISNTYVGLLKMSDNLILSSSLREISDGSGNGAGVYLNTSGDLKATGILEFGSLKDTGENITITKFVDEADGIANNDTDTSIPTSAAIVDYVASRITLEDLDFSGDSGTGSVDLDSQTFAIVGTANEIETSAGSQQLQIGLPSNVTISSNLQINGLLKGNNNIVIKDTSDRTMAAFYGGNKSELYFNDSKKLETTSDGATISGGLTATASSTFTSASFTGTITGNVTGDLTGNVTATSVLADGVTATTQSINDNSTKIATTAYVDASIDTTDTLAEILAIGNTTGGTDIAVSANDDITFTDTSKAIFGDGNDLSIYHTANSFIYNTTGDLVLEQTVNDRDIIFKSDDGSGGTTEYLRLDGSNPTVVFSKSSIHTDNIKAYFGTGLDLEIYHDGSNSYVSDQGTGELKLLSSSVAIQSASGGEYIAYFAGTGGQTASLYAGNSKKFETSSTGITVTGVVVSDGLDVGDNEKIRLGDSQDLEIYHNGTHSYIDDTGTGKLIIRGNDAVEIHKYTGEYMITANADGSVNLYNDDSVKLSTTATGITVTGVAVADGLDMGDDEKIRLGNSQDLEIYHSGSDSYIRDVGQGGLRLTASYFEVLDSANSETMIKATENSTVELYNDNSKKLETTSSGISITGGIDATGNLTITNTLPHIDLIDSDNNDDFRIRNNNGVYEILDVTNTGVRFKIDSDGHSQVTGNLQVDGNQTITGDLTVNGTTTTVNTQTLAVEDPLISLAKDNSANSVDIGFYGRYNDGSDKYLGLFSDASDSNTFKLFKGTGTEPTTTVDTTATGYALADLDLANLSASSNVVLESTAPLLYLNNTTASTGKNWRLSSASNGKFFITQEGVIDAITLEHTTGNATFSGDVSLADSKVLKLGTSSDLQLFHNGSNSHIQNATGDLYIENLADDKQVIFRCDDGSGGFETYFALEGASGGANPFTVWPDNAYIALGSNHDTTIHNTGSEAQINNYTGSLTITQHQDDGNIIFKSDNGSGGTTEYFRVDGGNQSLNVSASLGMYFNDGCALRLGNDSDITMYHDNTNGYITNSTGILNITNNDIRFKTSGAETMLRAVANGSVELMYDNTTHIKTTSAGTLTTGTSSVEATSAVAGYFETSTSIPSNQIVHVRDQVAAVSTNSAGGIKISSSPGNDVFLLKRNDGATSYFALQNSSGTEFITTEMSGGNTTFKGQVSITGDGSNAATLTESSSGIFTIATVDDFIVDCASDISLDTGGNDIRFKVNGVEYGKFKDDSDDFAIFSSIQDKDIVFKGNDGGSTITALTLDMSNAGSATFNDDVDLGGKLTQTGTSGTNTFNTHVNIASGNLGIGDSTPDYSIEINQPNPEIRLEETTTGGSKRLTMKVNSSTSNAEIGANQSAQSLILQTASTDRITVRSDGNIGIGDAGYSSQKVSISTGTIDNAIYATSTDANCFASFRDNSSTGNVAFGAIGNSHVLRRDTTNSLEIDSAGSMTLGNFSPSGTPAGDYNSFEIGRQGNTITGSPFKSALYLSNNATITAGSTQFTYRNTGEAANRFDLEDGAFIFANAASGTAGNNITWDERFKIALDGKTGIGLSAVNGNLEVKSIQDSSFDEGIGVVRSNSTQTGYINMVGGAMNINAPSSIPIKFRDGGTSNLEINANGHTVVNNDLNVEGGIYGKSYTQTTAGSTTSIIDTGIEVSAGVWELYYMGNANDGGSAAYRSITTGLIIVSVDFTNPNVVNQISFEQIAIRGGGSSDINLPVAVKILQGGSEYDELNVATSGQTIRVKVTGWAGTVGANGQLRLTRRL